ncbi:MAG: J domain-containing protein [Spirochaetales bacterium]|nr:J domain-containing protein [Spirochaetales bacterium]
MTDREILGLGETYTREELKKAYRLRARLCHPDRNEDSLNSHLAMIRLNRAYAGLLAAVPDTAPVTPDARGDEAYRLYREGITLYQSIHPSRWKSVTRRGLFDPGAVGTDPRTPEIIESLIVKMAEAYRCFSRVAGEYDRSPWYEDSLRKMARIEKMTGLYGKIRESYGRG